MINTLTIEVNGVPVSVLLGSTVLQACEAVGAVIPRFCYHERLLVAGNCRMCLVEIAGSPKPQASCALPVSPNMKVFTDSPLVKKARESVMEFRLLNHPLDCPICDQGGECDRQDQSMIYGSDRSRRFETKRGVQDKDIGPLVKTVMTRCIHCTRCIRFSSEIAGVADLGTSGRGRSTEVGTYVSKAMTSEVSGNLIDLCPVGALTSKPYAFVTRPWELESVDTMDTMDGVGASVRVQSRGTEVLRVLPRENDELNQAWLGDKSRFSVDGAEVQRVVHAYSRNQGQRRLVPLHEGVTDAAKVLTSGVEGLQVVLSPARDIESIQAVQQRVEEVRQAGLPVHVSVLGQMSGDAHAPQTSGTIESHSRLGMSVRALQNTDACLRVGVNLRHEYPLLNLWLRESFLRDRVQVMSMGDQVDLSYPVQQTSRTVNGLRALVSGEHPWSKVLATAVRPTIIVGEGRQHRHDAGVMLHALTQYAYRLGNTTGWRVLNQRHSGASGTYRATTGMPGFTGFSGDEKVSLRTVGLMADDLKEAGYCEPTSSRWVAMTSHGDERLSRGTSVVLPMPLGMEAEGHYMNIEGRVQMSYPTSAKPQSHPSKAMTTRGVLTSQRTSMMAGRGVAGTTNTVQVTSVTTELDRPSWTMQSVTPVPMLRSQGMNQLGCAVYGSTPPRVCDYYRDGHVRARFSATMAESSRTLSKKSTFA
jgi:NADH dehydrogenase (ubiquinone) Fe-S protein 1